MQGGEGKVPEDHYRPSPIQREQGGRARLFDRRGNRPGAHPGQARSRPGLRHPLLL